MSILVYEFGASNKLMKVKRFLMLYFGMDSKMTVHLMQRLFAVLGDLSGIFRTLTVLMRM